MQPIVWKGEVIRFKENPIIVLMLETGNLSLNHIAIAAADPVNGITQEDQMQLAKLIGYSVSGFGDLSYADPDTVARADEIAAKLIEERANETPST
jgi:uncharacterized alpha/beta hydrolase family protein